MNWLSFVVATSVSPRGCSNSSGCTPLAGKPNRAASKPDTRARPDADGPRCRHIVTTISHQYPHLRQRRPTSVRSDDDTIQNLTPFALPRTGRRTHFHVGQPGRVLDVQAEFPCRGPFEQVRIQRRRAVWIAIRQNEHASTLRSRVNRCCRRVMPRENSPAGCHDSIQIVVGGTTEDELQRGFVSAACAMHAGEVRGRWKLCACGVFDNATSGTRCSAGGIRCTTAREQHRDGTTGRESHRIVPSLVACPAVTRGGGCEYLGTPPTSARRHATATPGCLHAAPAAGHCP